MMSFLGIPYAAPPTGDLRCGTAAGENLARHTPGGGIRTGLPPDRRLGEVAAERGLPDAQVSAPVNKASKPYPVLFFIYGGGFVSGAGSDWGLEAGKSIVQNGMIFVTMNYRLGALGFFAHPELSAEASDHASGNQALRDQDRRAAMDQTQHRRVWRRSGSYHHCRQLVWRRLGNRVDGFTFGQGTFPTLYRRKRRGRPADCQSDRRKDLERSWVKLSGRRTWRLAQAQCRRPAQAGVAADAQSGRCGFYRTAAAKFRSRDTRTRCQCCSAGMPTKGSMRPAVTAANYESALQQGFEPQFLPFLLAQYPGKTDAQATASSQRLITDLMGQQHFSWATMQQKTNTQPAYIIFLCSLARRAAGRTSMHPCLQGRTWRGSPLCLWPIVARAPPVEQR